MAIATICIFFTAVYQFPNGLVFSAPITKYKATAVLDNPPSVFEHSDQMFSFRLYHKTAKREATAAEYAFIIQAIGVVTVNNGVQTTLEMSTSCKSGKYCFRSSALNNQAKISGNQYLRLHIKHCPLFMMDPTLGMCLMVKINFEAVLTLTTFTETTSSLVEST